jgi:hypothetical protein
MSFVIYTSALIPEASPVARTPRQDDIIYVHAVSGFDRLWVLRNRKSGDLEEPLHEWQYVRM